MFGCMDLYPQTHTYTLMFQSAINNDVTSVDTFRGGFWFVALFCVCVVFLTCYSLFTVIIFLCHPFRHIQKYICTSYFVKKKTCTYTWNGISRQTFPIIGYGLYGDFKVYQKYCSLNFFLNSEVSLVGKKCSLFEVRLGTRYRNLTIENN